MKEQPAHADAEQVLASPTPDTERQLAQVEYQEAPKDWRNDKLASTNQHGAINTYKFKDMLKNEP